MRVAVLSGKGGTGKTLVAVNLAAVAPASALYIDCDVEEPNGHLFFKPENVRKTEIGIKIPVVHGDKCTGCRQCVDFCQFNALAYIKDHPLVFAEICHSCGGCVLICPEQALTEKEKVIGQVQTGSSEQVMVKTGILNPGEASGIPIIKQLLTAVPAEAGHLTFIDCPPGSACPVMESIKDADYCLLVAEPTLFGVHNLQMVYELVKLFKKPFGAILNKCLDKANPAEDFCIEQGIPILGWIPFDQELGRLNGDGLIAARESEHYQEFFAVLLATVLKEAGGAL